MCNKNTAVAIMTANHGTAHVYVDTQQNTADSRTNTFSRLSKSARRRVWDTGPTDGRCWQPSLRQHQYICRTYVCLIHILCLSATIMQKKRVIYWEIGLFTSSCMESPIDARRGERVRVRAFPRRASAGAAPVKASAGDSKHRQAAARSRDWCIAITWQHDIVQPYSTVGVAMAEDEWLGGYLSEELG